MNLNRNEHDRVQDRNRELAEEANNRESAEQGIQEVDISGKQEGKIPPGQDDGKRASPHKRPVGGIKRNIEYAEKDQPRVKRYRIYKKGPDKIRSIRENEAYDAYDICEKDLQKHTGRPPGCERRGGASASGRASDI